MKKLAFIWVLLLSLFTTMVAQKSNVLATFQLIENGKFEEAKESIEEAIKDEKTSKWSKTWYAKGLLCQTAYNKGIEEKDKKKYELYPNQLYVAYESYKKAIKLNNRGRIQNQLEPRYVMLANEFLTLGKRYYKEKKYEESLKAFEYALQINQSEILTLPVDTNLVYNTALAAYKNKDYEKSIDYLSQLNEMHYSPNVPHLLFSIQLEKEDTMAAKEALVNGIKEYEENEELNLLLVDLHFQSNNIDKAIEVLNMAISKDSANYIYPYTLGLVYQKSEFYSEAINAYKRAIEIDPDKTEPYLNAGTCYFNIGVELEEKARAISNNMEFIEEKAKSVEAREAGVYWLEKAYKMDPSNETVKTLLIQLYKALNMTEKLQGVELNLSL